MTALAVATASATSFAPFLQIQAEAALTRRYEINLSLRADAAALRVEMDRCRTDIAYWVNTYVDTFDPRFVSDGCPATMPFVLFPRQVEFLHWLAEREKLQQDGSCDKSREVGVSLTSLWSHFRANIAELPSHFAMCMAPRIWKKGASSH